MTDIASARHIAPAQTQLPVSAYFDEARFAREQELIFKQSSLYVGHQKLVPEVGDWRTLPQEDGGRVLVRNPQGVELISNVCRHRQALML
ncbi:aromatic ring-hydroxylating dioxygenase subunit alpha, partial [Bordetella petrii]|nr:aromatic ring-hydroxylating dioxygenase subunit alpha [Bordetella petrii]